ncbi:hypothetical protein [Shewanella phage FishSpeaker]|nr:hypothetical protein [Shewanella phage FishSpeaker]
MNENTEEFKELGRFFPSKSFSPEVVLIVGNLLIGAKEKGNEPLEVQVVSFEDKCRSVLIRVKGQKWKPLAKWSGPRRKLHCYTTLPDHINYKQFVALDEWCDKYLSRTAKRVVYLETRL